jgi:hypothetical protein
MKFVSREQWGARPPKYQWSPLRKVKGIVVHHSGVRGGPHGADAVRSFERHHMDTRGWNAIAYNWLVDSDGTVYEGRGSGVMGGATRGKNSSTESICYIGFGDVFPVDAVEGIRSVIAHLQLKYGYGLFVKGHRDFASTACPGEAVYAWLQAGAEEAPSNPNAVDWDGIVAFLKALRADVARKPLSRRRRSRGEAVRAAQRRLKDRGCDPGAADGIFGKRTTAAVKQFQRNVGSLKVDGVIGVRTWDALFLM